MNAASKKFVPYLNITAHIADAPDQGMLSAKGANYFPYVCIMDAAGDVITEFRPSDEKALNAALELGRTYVGFREKAETDPKAKAAFAVMQAFNAKEPPAYPELKKLVAASGLEATHAKMVEDGMAKVAKALLTNIMKSADAEMRAAMNDEDRKTKFEAIDKKRCESILKLYDQGVSFSAEQPMAISFYTGAATAAVNKKDAALAKKLAAKAEVGIKRLLKQYDTAIERSSGRRKSSLEERRENIQGMLDNLTKKVAALQAPSSDG